MAGSTTKQSLSRYLRLNGKFLREGEALLRTGDYVQASEKFWGAAAEIVKAVAAKRGVSLGTHRSVSEFVSRLDREHPELSLATDFHVANSLHINFYEDWLDPRMVGKGAEAVRSFVQKLERFL